jgi:hypothetical protein
MDDRRVIIVEACGKCCHYIEDWCAKDIDQGVAFPVADKTKIASFCPLPRFQTGSGGYSCTSCGDAGIIGFFDAEGNIYEILCPSCFSKELKRWKENSFVSPRGKN